MILRSRKEIVMKKTLFLLMGLLLASLCMAAAVPEGMVKEFTLANGMHFLVVERHEFPTVSCIIFFDVGSGDEPRGKTGMAHLLEHLMFKGTRELGVTSWQEEKPLFEEANNATLQWIETYDKVKKQHPYGVFKEDEKVPDSPELKAVEERIKNILDKERQYIIKDEYWGTYNRHGGSRQNAFTDTDYTGYFVVLPSNKLELWGVMESNRIRDAVFREFYSERDVVMEEKRLSDESQPDSRISDLLQTLAFPAHPYGRPVVGYWDDLRHMRYEDVLKFYTTYYKPNNAVAVVVGDVTLKDVEAVAKKYFEPLPKGEIPERLWTEEPPMEGQRTGVVYFDAQPQISLGYRVPGVAHADFPALQLTANILGRGESSRLHRRLVLKDRIARYTGAWCGAQRDPGLITINSEPFKDHTLEEVEKAIREEVETLKNTGPTDEELQKVKNRYHANVVYRLENPTWLAMSLAMSYTYYKDWRHDYQYLDRIDAVTAEDIRRVANEYLIPGNEIKVVLERKEKVQ
jgi:predicted Zn-dependent peptidase